MKTAMQELIEQLQYHFANESRGDFFDASKYLEKEKEQIMNAYVDGAKGGANGDKGQHEFGWVSTQTKEKYYKQTYNQNK